MVAIERGVDQHEGFAGACETHAAVVFLLGDRAYKLKKPVDLGFLDFTHARERGTRCASGRSSSTAGSRPTCTSASPTCSDPDGAVCDHLVVMRRMPAERRLSDPRAAGDPSTTPLRQLARLVAAFHARRRPQPADRRRGRRGTRSARRWTESFAPGACRSGRPVLDDVSMVDEIEELGDDFLAGREPLFAAPDRRTVGSSTATATCSPTTSSASTTGRASSTASSSTTGCATAMCSPTSPSSPWTSSTSAHRGSRPLPRLVRRVRGRSRTGLAAPPLRCLPGVRPDQGRVRPDRAGRPLRRRDRRLARLAAQRRDYGGHARHRQTTLAAAWPTGLAPSCSPATGCARNSPVSRPSRRRRIDYRQGIDTPAGPSVRTPNSCCEPKSSSNAASRLYSTPR